MNRRKLSLILVLSLIIGILGATGETKQAAAARINLGEADMNGEVSIVLDKESYIYTGQPIEPVFQVVYKGTTLTPGTDYDYMIRDNTEVGWGLIIVDGAGEYEDRISKLFKIEAAATSTTTPEASATPEAAVLPS